MPDQAVDEPPGEKMSVEEKIDNAPQWSKVLATPMSGDIFSPAREIGDKESLHGAGLQKALDHGKMVARSGRRCSLMILEGASCYDQFGVALMKACQGNPLGDGETFKSISSLSQQTRLLSIGLKEGIATPLKGYHDNIGETFSPIHQKYVQSRQKAYGARQRAVLAHTKYVKAVKEAEEACNAVQKSVKEQSTSTDENKLNKPDTTAKSTKVEWEKTLEEYGKLKAPSAVDHVVHLLNDVKVLQRRYEALVEKENKAVQLAHSTEAAALEGTQKMEEHRLCVFYDGLLRTFQQIKISLDNLVISAEVDLDESSKEQVKVVQKKGDFFSTILKVGAAQEETTGVADADALGLDEDVGHIRDKVQTRIASRLARLKKVKALAALFADVSSAADKLGNDLQQMVKQEDSYVSSKGTPVEHLRTLLSNCEGQRTLQLWNGLMKTMEREGEAFLQFSRVLGSIKSSKLDELLSPTKEKEIQEIAEQDDARWRHLCDAARAEMRAETKYRTASSHVAKARERMGSVDQNNLETDGNKPTKSPQKPQNRAREGMNKAFGNFLSILPDGGEQAMQILSPDAKRSIVEKQVAEADEKELKVKQAFDNAVAYKTKIMDSYRSNAQPLAKRYELEEMAGVEDIKAAMASLVACLKTLRLSRYEILGPKSELGEHTLASALVDLNDWVEKSSKEMEAKKPVARLSDATATSGFMLMYVLAESEKAKQVLQFARIGTSDSFDSDCSERSEKDDASRTSGPTIRASTDQDSNRSLDLTEEEADKDNKGAKWLKKSFSSPIGKSGGFKTFRKLHSASELGKDQSDNTEIDAADDATETSTVSTSIPPQNSQEIKETELFSLFCPDYEGSLPAVINSFACAFLPKDCTLKSVAAVEHGRLFLTHKGAIFVAWKGKKAVVPYSMMMKAEKSNRLFGLAEDTLQLFAQTKGQESSLLLSCFSQRDHVFEIVQTRIEASKKARAEANEKTKKEEREAAVKEADVTTPIAPDAVMGKLETVLSKKIRGVPISRFHEIVWLDMTSEATFYGDWLGQGSCKDIEVGEWETSDEGFSGAWCGEKYSHKRQLTFQLKRNSMIGPPVAGVTQTQYCRVDDNNRSVMMMTVAFDSIPYSDCFTVEVRWVATRSGRRDINVQVGVFVEFHKSTLLKSQIRSGTMSETKPVHESLFKFVKTALDKEAVVEELTEEEEAGEDEEASLENAEGENEGGVMSMMKDYIPQAVMDNLHIAAPVLGILLFIGLRWTFSSSSSGEAQEIAKLNAKIDDLQTEMQLLRQAVERLAEKI